VINLVALRMNDWEYLTKEIKLLSGIVHNKSKLLKVIIESGELTEAEIIQCCDAFGPLNIDFMKTSTGFAGKGASVNDVQLMRRHLPSHVKIKASGGIRTYEFAKALTEAGADRLGCSASVAIVSGEPGLNHSTY
jgi:deoxyribose-phosphate aldolase